MISEKPLAKIQVALSPQERFEEFLQSRGMRNTSQRKTLIDHVFSYHEHFDADSLMERLPPKGDKDHVSRATVYRTLTEFVDAGLLREIQLDGRSVYEHDYGYPAHDHLYCTQCQQLFEFQSSELASIRDHIARDRNFKATGHRFIIDGVCNECQQNRRRIKRKVDMV
jgi:Fur family transcriptional regulator, ferric uptake regulator